MMDEYIEPKYSVGKFEDHGDGSQPHSMIVFDEDYDLSDPEAEVWDLTSMMKWCVENLNGEYKIVLTGYDDFYIELYDEDDAAASKLRWN